MEVINVLSKNTNVDHVRKAAQESQSLEEFIEASVKEFPENISLNPPHISAVIPHLCRLIQGRNITDQSHYDGYKPNLNKRTIPKADLSLKGNSLFLNDHDLQCDLDDPSLVSFRIQLQISQRWKGGKHHVTIPEVGFYFDFWDEEKGFSKKGVVLYVKLDDERLGNRKDEISRADEEETTKHSRRLKPNPVLATKEDPPKTDQLNLL
jgi:hypothetical protein